MVDKIRQRGSRGVGCGTQPLGRRIEAEVSNLACSVGFKDLSSFRERFGITPAGMRIEFGRTHWRLPSPLEWMVDARSEIRRCKRRTFHLQRGQWQHQLAALGMQGGTV